MKQVVVTGAAGVVGTEVCSWLVQSGWSVIALDLRFPAPDAPVAGLRVQADLTVEAEAIRVFAEIGAQAGQLSGLVNIAGGFAWETVAGGEVETWDRLYNLNLKTALNACRAVLPTLASGGAIVNIGAAVAARAGAGMGAYAASKAGVARLTESLAAEQIARGIRVNAVLPSIVDTPANRADMPDADVSLWVTPGELAHVIDFLLSDRASGITGASIPVTGRA